ncbi:MAG: hypothetical protein K6F15_06240 [Treponema sp.]|nr:hypothetical protein [Treponema sp.]
MKTDCEKLKQFDEKYIPSLVKRLLPLWNVPGESEDFNRRYVEMIIRTNMHINDMQFMMTEKTAGKDDSKGSPAGGDAVTDYKLKAIAFSALKSDKSDDAWFTRLLEGASSCERTIFQTGRRYLNYMEEKTFSLMKDDDLKLCLFVSLERGCGSRILSEAVKEFKVRDYKNMFLWTDCECNVQWYFDNGWKLLNEEEYDPFSRGTGGSGEKTDDDRTKFMTYIFKKGL